MGRVRSLRPPVHLSRRTVLRALAASASLPALAGCAALSDTVARLDVAELTSNPTLLVATNRKPIGGGREKPWYGPERARLSVARAKLAAPDEGRFSMASVGLSDWGLQAVEPVGQMRDLMAPASAPRDVLLYVHGFNQTFETAAIDAARLSDGIKFRGATMVFSWPSKAKLFDYGYDRESAMWSRDALEQVFSGLVTNPAVGRVHVVAHSIGTMLAMEGLRQIYDRRGGVVVERIGAVVFASPDIDMDVFSSSVERIGPLARKITVVTSTNDRALAVSGWIAGGITRVGAAEQDQLKRLGLSVIDASGQGWGIINHDLFLSNDRIREVIRRAVEGRTPERA
ncbi:MAG: alpha/beta hydrolase [Hyphomicrobiales bacterium]|nr:alpha/beta hydrolase [Hyphomicrobiales bacterium]